MDLFNHHFVDLILASRDAVNKVASKRDNRDTILRIRHIEDIVCTFLGLWRSEFIWVKWISDDGFISAYVTNH